MKFFKQAQKYGSKALAVAGVATLGASSAMAQSTNPIVTMIEGIGLDGVTAAVIAVCVIVVGIALAMKGPDVAKRVIRKV